MKVEENQKLMSLKEIKSGPTSDVTNPCEPKRYEAVAGYDRKNRYDLSGIGNKKNWMKEIHSRIHTNILKIALCRCRPSYW